MSSLLLRLIGSFSAVLILLVMLMQIGGRLLPLAQIIPIITYDSPTILLIDVNRHVAASRRTNPNPVFNAVVSPDQQQIAFSMSDTHQMHIYAGGLYDQDYRPITHDTPGGDNPAWSPDGRQIAFVGFEPDNKRGIYTVAVDGSSPVQTIVKAGTFASPEWSPDGRYIAFASSFYRDLPDVFMVDSRCRLRCDRQVVQITNTLVADTFPIWSPDGSKMTFMSNRTGTYQIFLLDMRCLQPDETKCTLQVPQQFRFNELIIPIQIVWSFQGSDLYFRAWDALHNQPGLYAINGDCPTLQEGCQPRLIYNLVNGLQRKRG